MTRRELGALVLRIAALFLFISAFTSAAQVASYFVMNLQSIGNFRVGRGGDSGLFMIFGILLQCGLYVAGGVYLARSANSLGAALFAGKDLDSRIARIDLEDAQSAAFSVMGIYLIVSGISTMLTLLAYLRLPLGANTMYNQSFWGMFGSSGIRGFVQVTLGWVLVFRSRGLVVFLSRLRRAGVYEGNEAVQAEAPARENDPHS